MMKRTLIPLVMCLSACDVSPPPQPQTDRPPHPVFETQIRAIKKAQAVEGQVLNAAEAQRKQMEEAAQ
jgi:hypothetical protein